MSRRNEHISLAAAADVRDGIDRPRLPVRGDYHLRPRPARIWARPRNTRLCREIWRLAALGGDGFLSGRNRGLIRPIAAGHRLDLGYDRARRGVVSAGSHAL